MPPTKTLRRGTRRQVWNGKAEKTAGGLTKDDLDKNKRGRIVSKKKTARMSAMTKDSDSEPEDEKKEVSTESKGFWNLFT
jgi:hypothetical protein